MKQYENIRRYYSALLLLVSIFWLGSGNVTILSASEKEPVFDEQAAFCRVFLAQDTITRGDVVQLTYRFYTQLNINEVGKIEYPDYEGFAYLDMELDESAEFEAETYNDKQYYAVDIRRVVLYAHEAGTKMIEPARMEIEFEMEVGEGKERKRIDLKHTFVTDRLTLEVLDDRRPSIEDNIISIDELDNTRDLSI